VVKEKKLLKRKKPVLTRQGVPHAHLQAKTSGKKKKTERHSNSSSFSDGEE